MPLVLTLDPSTVGVRRTSNSATVAVFAVDTTTIIPVEFGGVVIVIPPTVLSSGPCVIFAPDVFHTSTRRDTTVVFGPDRFV